MNHPTTISARDLPHPRLRGTGKIQVAVKEGPLTMFYYLTGPSAKRLHRELGEAIDAHYRALRGEDRNG